MPATTGRRNGRSLDAATIKAGIDPLTFYNGELAANGGLQGRGEWRSTFCPFHENRDTPALRVNVQDGGFKCMNPDCGASGGDVFDFYQRFHSCDLLTALAELAPLAGVVVPDRAPAQPEPNTAPIDEAIIDGAQHRLLRDQARLDYLRDRRGLTDETIRQWQIGFYEGRIAIPIRDELRRCVNIRRYDPEARQSHDKMISWRSGYGGARLFPLCEALLDRPGEPVLIVEGEWDCLLARQNGFNAVTCTGGAGTWRDEWNRLFAGRDVAIWYDRDDAGRAGAQQVAEALVRAGARVRIVHTGDGDDGADLTDFVVRDGWTVEQVQERIDAAVRYEPTGEEPEAAEDAEDAPPSLEDVARQAESGVDYTAGGKIRRDSQENIRLALRGLGVALGYDEFSDQLLVSRDGDRAEHLSDPIVNRLWLEIDEKYGFRPGKDFFRTVLEDHARQNAFHPVVDYLDALEWDGTPRLDRWLSTYGGASDTEYTRAVGPLWMIAAVRRVRRPGVKFDEMPVLESPQGANKSSAIKVLTGGDAWFSDDLPLGASAQVVMEQTVGKWILEAAELSGMTRKDVETLKAFLSRQTDRARLAYGRMATERPRHFVVIGTTNSNRYLKDVTGNRRFWPVRVDTFDLDALRRDRDQLWAEAAHREAAGESIRLDPALYAAAGEEQEQRREDDPWEQRLAEVLDGLTGKLSTEDAWKIVGKEEVGQRTQFDNSRLGAAMQRLGFERKKLRIDGQPRFCYAKGDDQERSRQIDLRMDAAGRVVGADAPPPF